MSDDMLSEDDATMLYLLRGANFIGGSGVTLPSGRKMDPSEIQALTSAYANPVEDLPPPPKRRFMTPGKK